MINRYTKRQNLSTIILTTNLNVINHNFQVLKSAFSSTPENYS